MTGLTRMTGMARFRRPVVTALIVCAALAVLPACGKRNTDQETLRKIVEHTRRLGAKFEYHDDRPDSKVEVQGLVEDDFRFKTRVFYDGQPAFDEVVSDDVLAMRVLDPSRLGLLVDRKQADPKTESELQGVSVIDVLRSRRWVQDPTGAPVVSGLGQTEATLGVDPAIDAVTSLDYTLAAINQSAGVRKWDKDSLSPTYARTEDPFEQPSRESGITRYDLARP
ncbi:MAG TPA: hypothetical protein VGO92_01790, partial [Acidimicrobiales bacterium]|nr:hypothetical protein [Acidimicrobiales bacterium]